jgi:hypothetical protein
VINPQIHKQVRDGKIEATRLGVQIKIESRMITSSFKEGIFVRYRGYEHNRTQPLVPFGFGLSYTTCRYDHLSVASAVAAFDNVHYTVSLDVTNAGSRPGSTVAQVYVAEDAPHVPRPPKELKGFRKLMLQPGEPPSGKSNRFPFFPLVLEIPSG